MVTLYADPGLPASGPLAEGRSLDAYLRVLEACGRERLAPLAQHMAQKRLVRARGDVGASLRRLDVHTLREALSRMLSHEWEDRYLIYQLVVEGMEPTQVAAERGVSRATLVEQLRDAVDELALEYEDTANAHLTDIPTLCVSAAPARKRR